MTPHANAHEWHRHDPLPPDTFQPASLAEADLIADERRAFTPDAATAPVQVALANLAPITIAPAASLMASVFDRFAPRVKTRSDGRFIYVESDGLPAHGMMVGITSWQQQVPLPQPYSGANAWRIPLHPIPARQPQTIKNHFLRGAIALAANGIPIFNPQNNRGEISQDIGELDQWGGHCGRADDYHYHAAPLHLQETLGKGLPIAYALDGYPIYGISEPDGSTPRNLDVFNGHETAALGYHYHGSLKYPFINGGFHGEVVEREGQVDPQPRAQPLREAGAPLRGARITAFSSKDNRVFHLTYEVRGETRHIQYALNTNGSVKFDFTDAGGRARSETYSPQIRGAGRNGGGDRPPDGRGPDDRPRGRRTPPPGDGADGRPAGGDRETALPNEPAPARSGRFVLRSPAFLDRGIFPVEFTGDGTSASPPLEWSGAPKDTRSYAIIMHHFDREGRAKWYWTLYNIPPDVHSLSKNVQDVGTLGNNGINHRVGYAPPHSKGPGAKTYILTAYALSAPLSIARPPADVSRDVLLSAMKDLILDSAELQVVYERTGILNGPGAPDRPRRRDDAKAPKDEN